MTVVGFDRTLELAAISVATLSIGLLVLTRVRVRVRVPVRVPLVGSAGGSNWIARTISGLGLLVALSSPAGATGKRMGSPRPWSPPAPEAPWSETDGSPPPLPSVGTRAITEGGSQPPWTDGSSVVHPAVHGARGFARSLQSDEQTTPLFPRSRAQRNSNEEADRERSMRMHPAGKAAEGSVAHLPNVHRVVAGESLWTIAEATLRTQDPVRVARYWHQIHRVNREVIGSDPNILFPGQQLTLPAERV